MTPIPACAPVDRLCGREDAVVVMVTVGGMVEGLVEDGKSELWKRTWTEKASTEPGPVGVSIPITLVEEKLSIVSVCPAETEDWHE